MEQYLIDLIAAIIGAIMALVFEFFPVVKTWFEALTKAQKQLVIGGMALLISAAMFGINCAGWIKVFFPDFPLTCDIPGALLMLRVFVAILGSAQAVHITINKLINIILGKDVVPVEE